MSLRNEIKQLADNAYCAMFQKNETDTLAKGERYKMEHGEFGPAELDAHRKIAEYWGKHLAFSEVVRMLDARALNREAAMEKAREALDMVLYNATESTDIDGDPRWHFDFGRIVRRVLTQALAALDRAEGV